MTTKPKTKRKDPLPKGFIRHRGKAAPVDETTRVICAIRTVNGVVVAPPGPAYAHIWEENLHDDGIGAIVGWRLA